MTATAISILLALVACGPSPAPTITTTTTDLPTFSAGTTATGISELPTLAPSTPELPKPIAPTGTPEPDRMWLEQPFGSTGDAQNTLAVYFYTDETGRSCIRTMVNRNDARPVEGCAEQASTIRMVAVQGVEKDSSGAEFNIIAGRVLDKTATVVVLEFNDNSTPLNAPVDDQGFIVILPGQKRAIQAVPVDQFGNLVGSIFKFR